MRKQGVNKMKMQRSNYVRIVAVAVLIAFAGAGCASNGGGLPTMTDTTKGGILGGATGAAIGAIIDAGNPWAGALIGAAGGALTGAIVGHFMDERKKDLEKALAPQINAGLASVQILKDHAVLVTMTGTTAFAPGSSVVNQGFIPTLQTIANVVKTYGKTTVAVIGHPDATGTISERQTLANQRAEAVRSMLLLAGVSPALVTSSGNANSKYMDGRVEVVIHPLISATS
jgi:outer membrane protein OmpA-like peptidoglycan-associated protein